MSYVLLGVLLALILISYFMFWKNRKKDPNQHGMACERTEDKGFYENLDPAHLPLYQTALSQLFSLLDAPRFEGTLVPPHLREAVEQALADAAANPPVKTKYLRVMLCQFLKAKPTVRRQDDVLDHWAEQVYELDRKGVQTGPQGIPSAWKIHFHNSLNTG